MEWMCRMLEEGRRAGLIFPDKPVSYEAMKDRINGQFSQTLTVAHVKAMVEIGHQMGRPIGITKDRNNLFWANSEEEMRDALAIYRNRERIIQSAKEGIVKWARKQMELSL